MGITDHAYFLFLTDLGVSRDYERRGIGRSLVTKAHEAVGGTKDITIITWANRAAMPLYAACGIVPQEGLIGKEATNGDLFDVRDT
jgi:ribosomal protein S18 acetylase RimI-like enzyme